MSEKNVTVVVGHRSYIPVARWCRPVGWQPANQVEGAEWSAPDGAWLDEEGEAGGVVVYGREDDEEGQEITVPLDALRVVTEERRGQLGWILLVEMPPRS